MQPALYRFGLIPGIWPRIKQSADKLGHILMMSKRAEKTLSGTFFCVNFGTFRLFAIGLKK
jgi:hypothetical protein